MYTGFVLLSIYRIIVRPIRRLLAFGAHQFVKAELSPAHYTLMVMMILRDNMHILYNVLLR